MTISRKKKISLEETRYKPTPIVAQHFAGIKLSKAEQWAFLLMLINVFFAG
ncbi:MAG: hypothetical protein P8179_12145 [Candidatus Thiodiazotropha sp.]|jgi:hypothetical protein